MNLNPLYLYINFLSAFDSELGGRFWRTILQITESTQSTILNRNILRPNKPVQKSKTHFKKQAQIVNNVKVNWNYQKNKKHW